MKTFKILIIEDDPTTCTLLQTTLDMEGYQSSCVYSMDNKDILSVLNEEQPDILFLDFYLGSKETLKYLPPIRHDSDWQRLPIVMTSAIDHGEDCLRAGADGFILKPFNWNDLTTMVNGVRDKILKREEI